MSNATTSPGFDSVETIDSERRGVEGETSAGECYEQGGVPRVTEHIAVEVTGSARRSGGTSTLCGERFGCSVNERVAGSTATSDVGGVAADPGSWRWRRGDGSGSGIVAVASRGWRWSRRYALVGLVVDSKAGGRGGSRSSCVPVLGASRRSYQYPTTADSSGGRADGCDGTWFSDCVSSRAKRVPVGGVPEVSRDSFHRRSCDQ
jgi:hypothetical protein